MILLIASDADGTHTLLSRHASLAAARADARRRIRADPSTPFWMLDLQAGCYRDRRGCKTERRHTLAERLVQAYRAKEWVPGADLIGITYDSLDDRYASWNLTYAEREALWSKTCPVSRGVHFRDVWNALVLGKPVPDNVIAELRDWTPS